jgi:hypothetical protein
MPLTAQSVNGKRLHDSNQLALDVVAAGFGVRARFGLSEVVGVDCAGPELIGAQART